MRAKVASRPGSRTVRSSGSVSASGFASRAVCRHGSSADSPRSSQTRADKKGNDRYIVNGQKVWTSRVLQSDLMLLLARTEPKEKTKKRTDGLSVFLVDMRLAQSTSITINPIRTMMNHATTQVFFDDLRVPAENLIGEEGQGFRYILAGRSARTRACSFRSRAPMRRCAPPN